MTVFCGKAEFNYCYFVGTTSIRAYEQQSRFTEEFERLIDEAQMAFYALLMSYRWLFALLESLNDILILITTMFAMAMRGSLSPGLASLLVTYPLQLTYCGNYVLRAIADVGKFKQLICFCSTFLDKA